MDRQPQLVGRLLLAIACAAGGACTATEPLAFNLSGRGEEPGAGGTPITDAGPDATVPPTPDAAVDPDPDLDPDVVFDWKSTVPGGGGCAAGDYVGTFECRSGGAVALAGITTFTLVTVNSETQLEVRPGKLEILDHQVILGDADPPVVLRAVLAGGVDCSSDGFTAIATAEQVLLRPPPLGLLAPIAAEIEGVLQRPDQQISGTISVTGGLVACAGPWTARRAP